MKIFRALKLIVGDMLDSMFFYYVAAVIWFGGSLYCFYGNMSHDNAGAAATISTILFVFCLFAARWLTNYLLNVWHRVEKILEDEDEDF